MSPRKYEVADELLSSLLANYKKPEDLIGGKLARSLGCFSRHSMTQPKKCCLTYSLVVLPQISAANRPS